MSLMSKARSRVATRVKRHASGRRLCSVHEKERCSSVKERGGRQLKVGSDLPCKL